MTIITAVKGTRDFYPEDMAYRSWLFAKIRSVSERFGYQEFDGPFLERLELYAAKSGEELVKEQSFVFPDRSGEMIALRPELTPTLARLVAGRGPALGRPIRWWSFGPFWRYERPQKGRSREFFQWNIDLLGVDSPQADAEIAATGAMLFQEVGLDPSQVSIRVNNRRLAEKNLSNIGIEPGTHAEVFRLIDRREKLPESTWLHEAESTGLSPKQIDGLTTILNHQESWQASDELVGFFEAAEALGIRDYLAYDPTVIRGLDYYTGTVFEARDHNGKFRAIFGGGRYDDLVADVGGDPLPGVGFAMGDMVIRLVLDAFQASPSLRPNPASVLVATFDEQTLPQALSLATEMRQAGLCVEWYPEPERLGKQFRYADKQGVAFTALVGPDELAQNKVSLKNMRSGEQLVIARKDLIPSLVAMLAQMELDLQNGS